MPWELIESKAGKPSVSCTLYRFMISTRAVELLPSMASWERAQLLIDTKERKIAIIRANDGESSTIKLTRIQRCLVFSSASTRKITGEGRWAAEVRRVKGARCLVFCYKEAVYE